jgi:TPR repeat protein
MMGLVLGLAPASALDGTPSDGVAPPPAAAPVRATPMIAAPSRALDIPRPPTAVPGAGRKPLTPVEAFRSGAEALRAGEKAKAVTSLQYAAEQGHALAQWKLGRMYAEGDGVERSDLRAFEYFRRIADAYADDSPGTPQARFVANAFVALGHYYLDGIPNSAIKADPTRAHEMFSYAASYFGDPDAQYYLARLYLDGKGTSRDARQAARWLSLAANKGQHQAQALLGRMLFKGEHVQRQAARGLMWLTLARESAAADEVWITELYDSAFKQATDDERTMALFFLERWVKGRRD